MPEINVSEAAVAPISESETPSDQDEDGKKDNSEAAPPEDQVEESDEWLDVLGSGDLMIKTLKKGTPNTRAQNFDTCTINIEESLEDGTVVDKKENFQVEVNGSEVIQGLDLVLPLLDVGQQVIATIKPRFAYGSIGLPPKIPKNACLTYNVELLKVDFQRELTSIPFEERIKRAQYKKEKGNWWYSRGEGNKAVQCYRAALDSLQDSTPYSSDGETNTEMPEEIFREMVQHRLIIYNNLAAAQLIISAYDSALISVDHVINLEPNNVKALFRKGKILFAKGDTDEAVETFTKVLLIEPDNSAAKKELAFATKRLSQEKMQAKSLYKKMFANEAPGKDEAKKKKSNPPERATSAWTKVLGAAASATVVAALAYGIGSKYKALAFWE